MPSPRLTRGHRVLKASPASSHHLWARLHQVADGARPAYKATFLTSVWDLRKKIPRELLAQAAGSPHAEAKILALVTVTPVLKALPSDASMVEITGRYQKLLYDAAKEAFIDLEAELPGLGKPFFELALTSPLVISYASRLAATMVTEVSAQTQAAIRQIIADAARTGLHPYQQADLIRQVVGLHSRQAAAVARYDTALRGQVVAGELTEARAGTLVASYADRLLDDRAEMIARTETLRAANMGVRMGGEALLELPFFNAGDLVYVWVVTPDDRLCPICEAMEDQTTDQDGNFQSDDEGAVESPPLHPNCRCAIARQVTDVDELQGRIDAFDEAEAALSPEEAEVEKEYDPNQPRDELGRWGDEGGASSRVISDPRFELDPTSDWRANPDPETRAVAVWQQDYDLNQNVRVAAANLQAGRDPLEGVSLSERTEGRFGSATDWQASTGTGKEEVLTSDQLKEEVVASARQMNDLVESASPSTQEYYRGMRVDDLTAFEPGSTHNVGITSFTPSAQEAHLYTAANEYRQGSTAVVVHLEPGASVADLSGKGIGAMRVSQEGVIRGTLQVSHIEMRGEVAHVFVSQTS